MSAEATVNALIAAGLANASKATDKAIGFADAAQTAASTVITELPIIPSPTRPDIDIPPFTNPDQDLSGDFTKAYNDANAEFGPEFATKFTGFLSTYYPSFNSCLTIVETWICNTIQYGGTGMNADVENAIWNRSRERESIEAFRQKSELNKMWAGRGFSFPPGVLVAQSAMIDQDLANKVSTHSRDVAIKQAEIEIDNVKFAVQQGAQLRISIMATALDYMRAFMLPWQLAIEKAKALVEAKRLLWQSSAAYYQALIAAASLELEYDKVRIDRSMDLAKLSVEQIVSLVQERVRAAISAAEAMGEIAASATGSQVSLGQIAHQTIEDGVPV